MKIHDRLYINGAWVASSSRTTIDVVNAATAMVIGRMPEGDADAARIANDSVYGLEENPEYKSLQLRVPKAD